MHSMFFKKLSVDEKIYDLPAALGGRGIEEGNLKISIGKVRPVTYLSKYIFESAILIKVVLTIIKRITGCARKHILSPHLDNA